jgi:HTH-type transcriptional regulator, sugar sensing transcriptional regulator
MIKNNLLLEIGLTENESNAYLALIEKGQQSPPSIADLLKIKRVTAYAVLKSLQKKGLAEEKDTKKKLLYKPLPPTALLDSVETRRKDIERAEKSLKTLIPELMKSYSLVSSKPGFVFFEGLSGIKNVYEEVLKERPEEVLIFRSVYDKEKLGKYFSGYKKRRAHYGIKTRIISPSKPTTEKVEKDKAYLRERRYVSPEKLTLGTQIDVFNDKVTFMTLDRNPMGFIIINKSAADSMRKIFNLIWELGD